MMTREAASREELEAALDFWQRPENSRELEPDELLIVTVARRQLALMPETCEPCNGTGQIENSIYLIPDPTIDCYDCHGSGKVYPPETVEKIALAVGGGVKGINYISSRDVTTAVAVLDALGGTE